MLHIDFESTKILKGAPLYVTQFENRVFTLVNFLKTILLSIFHNIIIKVVAASSGFCLLVYKMHLLFAWQSSSGFCWMQFCAVHSRRKKINELFSIEEEEKAITQSTSSLFVFFGALLSGRWRVLMWWGAAIAARRLFGSHELRFNAPRQDAQATVISQQGSDLFVMVYFP